MTTHATVRHPAAASTADTAIPSSMKAIVQDRYGSPEKVLKLDDVAVPVPRDGEVLIRVHAASIHVGDLVAIEGEPLIARMAVGFRKPKNRVPGTDVAGTVVAAGGGVTGLHVGDAVFGWCAGAFAEYACAPAGQFAPKPSNLTFEQAAAVGVSASAALQLLHGRIGPGRKVLINGASGGLGSYAIQIAAAFGAEVTGVCSAGNAGAVRSLGASHVLDYAKEDFTLGEQRYDFILDNVADHSLSQTRRALTADGVLQSNNGTSGGRWFGTVGTVLTAAIVSKFTRRQAGPSIKFPTREALLEIAVLIEAGQVTPFIGQTYGLQEAAEAAQHVAGGHARGTTVLTIGGHAPNTAE